jgi:poly(beta-D-mannuronate) lyase
MTMVWRYKQSGDPRTLACILAGYLTANAGAPSRQTPTTPGDPCASGRWQRLRRAGLNEIFTRTSLANHHAAETERWLGLLADQVVTDWDGLPLSKTNNHSYWAAWSVMATSVALNRRDLFDWSLKEYRAASQIDPDGSLPNEKKRGSGVLAYHHYALEPLVMMASFAHANRVDLMQENEGRWRDWRVMS